VVHAHAAWGLCGGGGRCSEDESLPILSRAGVHVGQCAGGLIDGGLEEDGEGEGAGTPKFWYALCTHNRMRADAQCTCAVEMSQLCRHFLWRARGWRSVTHRFTTEQAMDVWLLVIVFTGWVLGRCLCVLHQTFNDLYVLYTHRRNTEKTQWLILVYSVCFVRILECDSRYHANVVFSRLRGPRMMVDAHKLKNGRLREVLYGGNLNAWLVGRMRMCIN